MIIAIKIGIHEKQSGQLDGNIDKKGPNDEETPHSHKMFQNSKMRSVIVVGPPATKPTIKVGCSKVSKNQYQQNFPFTYLYICMAIKSPEFLCF